MIRHLLMMYAAGSFGALCNFFFGVLLTMAGIMPLLGIQLPPPDMPAALYQRLVWGGVWGAILLFPFPQSKTIWHGLILGIFPSMVAGLYFFPQRGLGVFGINLGIMMPLLILAFNWVWGSTMLWIYKQT